MQNRYRNLLSAGLFAGALVGASACNDAGDDSPFGSTTDPTGGVTGPETSDASSGSSSSTSAADSGEKLDIGMATTAEAGGDEGCRGVDFLFVIDNSGSMQDEQANLLSSFPGFIASMQGLLNESAQSFRVMVVDTDGIGAACIPICDMFGPTGYCNGISCDGEFCDVRNGGGNTVNQNTMADCGLPGGKRYADSDEIDIASAFSCIARVGTTGSAIELVADSLLTALSPDYLGASGCNDGFVRDDAVLVVTVITDEEDAGNDPYFTSPGDPASWYNDLAAVKDYDPNALVVLGLLGDPDDAGGVCQPYDDATGDGAQQATRLREFVGNFGDQGLFGSVCAPSYTDFFEQAVALIDTTCDNFVPPG